MHDSHFHNSEKIAESFPVRGIINAASPEEFEKLNAIKISGGFLISAGIHPWYADKYDFESMKPYIEKADFVGEIGLDNVWCDVSEDIQLDRFIRQLEFARELRKPVILHTKGKEKEILEIIKNYPNTYLVHWYSCMDYLEDYIKLGCYFSVGPSVGADEAVNQVAAKAPADRLLLETDGIGAVAWAFDCDEDSVDYKKTLERSVREISRLRTDEASGIISCKAWENQLDANFAAFIKA